MIRKCLISIFILLSLVLVCHVSYAQELSVNVSALTGFELEEFIKDVEKEIERHHEPDDTVVDDVLEAVQKTTGLYYSEQGIEISWAWYDSEYEYKREWDFYTLSTHLDYKDENNRHQQRMVYAELFPENNKYMVYYLMVDENPILDKRDKIPNKLWVSVPDGIVNESTGLNLSTISRTQLYELSELIYGEMSENHTPQANVSDWVLYLVKLEVEQHFSQQKIDVSWAWSEYEYTRDWLFYSLMTHIDYKDSQGVKQKPDVYAEVYPKAGRYALYYLSIGDQTLIDDRDKFPDILPDAGSTAHSTVSLTLEPITEPIPNETAKPKPEPTPDMTPKPKAEPTPDVASKPTPGLSPDSTPKPTSTLFLTSKPTEMPTPLETFEQTATPSANIGDQGTNKQIKIIHNSVVNVRKSATVDSEKVGSVSPGSFYDFLDTADNGWLKLRLENGVEGWVSGKMAVVLGEQATSSQLTPTEDESPKASKEEIELAASQIIIELTINSINRILEYKAIISYSIQSTDYVYFYMSYDFVRMSKDERQVMLDAINNALYSQIEGAGVPYGNYRYLVGETVIAENKWFTDPFSVKLK